MSNTMLKIPENQIDNKAQINLPDLTVVLQNQQTIDVFGELIPDSTMLSKVDSVLDSFDTYVELSINCDDFRKCFKFRNPDYDGTAGSPYVNGLYFHPRSANKTLIQTKLDTMSVNWSANDQVDGDDYRVAMQCRVVEQSNDKYLITDHNPNKNDMTSGYDGMPLSDLTFRYLADVIVSTPNGTAIFSNASANKNFLRTLNLKQMGEQIMEALFDNELTDSLGQPNGQYYTEAAGTKNLQLLTIYEQLVASHPERFYNLNTDNNGLVEMPFLEGDEFSFVLHMNCKVDSRDENEVIKSMISKGRVSSGESTFVQPFEDYDATAGKYNVRTQKYLITLRLSDSKAARKTVTEYHQAGNNSLFDQLIDSAKNQYTSITNHESNTAGLSSTAQTKSQAKNAANNAKTKAANTVNIAQSNYAASQGTTTTKAAELLAAQSSGVVTNITNAQSAYDSAVLDETAKKSALEQAQATLSSAAAAYTIVANEHTVAINNLSNNTNSITELKLANTAFLKGQFKEVVAKYSGLAARKTLDDSRTDNIATSGIDRASRSTEQYTSCNLANTADKNAHDTTYNMSLNTDYESNKRQALKNAIEASTRSSPNRANIEAMFLAATA